MMPAVCPMAPLWVPSAAGKAGPHTHPSAPAAFVLGAPQAQQRRPGLEDLQGDVLSLRRCTPIPGSWSRMVSVDPSLLFGSREPRGVERLPAPHRVNHKQNGDTKIIRKGLVQAIVEGVSHL